MRILNLKPDVGTQPSTERLLGNRAKATLRKAEAQQQISRKEGKEVGSNWPKKKVGSKR